MVKTKEPSQALALLSLQQTCSATLHAAAVCAAHQHPQPPPPQPPPAQPPHRQLIRQACIVDARLRLCVRQRRAAADHALGELAGHNLRQQEWRSTKRYGTKAWQRAAAAG